MITDNTKLLNSAGAQIIANQIKLRPKIVTSLPSSASTGDIVVLKSDGYTYRYANSKWNKCSVTDYNELSNKPTIPSKTSELTNDSDFATNTALTNAIDSLDVASVGGTGKYIKSISESNGKISAVESRIDTSMSDSSTNLVQNKVIKSYIDSAIYNNITSVINATY